MMLGHFLLFALSIFRRCHYSGACLIIRQPERVEARYEIENTGQEATERGRHAHMRAVRRARRGLCGIHDDRSACARLRNWQSGLGQGQDI